jgi:hypothetical protein
MTGQAPGNGFQSRSHHVADPAALEDPVHHDVAEHELHEEAESDQEPEPEEEVESGRPGHERGREVVESSHPSGRSEPFDLPIEPTGDTRVDAALSHLDLLGGLPAVKHADLYEDIHVRLQAALNELDQRHGS